MVSAEKNISSFIRLHLSISGTVELIQADEEKVIIETDENLQQYLEVINSGRTLYVNNEGKWRVPCFSKLTIKIYYRQLYHLYNAAENGTLICANTLKASEPVEVKIYSNKSINKLNINAPAVKLITTCVGDVEIAGACNILEIKASSEGNLYARNMMAKSVMLKNYSAGNLEIFASETLSIINYGEGHINYWGAGVLKNIKHNGSGEVKHSKD